MNDWGMPRFLGAARLSILAVILLVGACVQTQPAPTQEQPDNLDVADQAETSSPTPDPCTGWTCEVNGVVYNLSADPGNEVEGINLTLVHSSNCSPTRGEHDAQSAADGSFTFNSIFFHDTDRVQIQLNSTGANQIIWDSVGESCYYCGCFNDQIEIVLSTIENAD